MSRHRRAIHCAWDGPFAERIASLDQYLELEVVFVEDRALGIAQVIIYQTGDLLLLRQLWGGFLYVKFPSLYLVDSTPRFRLRHQPEVVPVNKKCPTLTLQHRAMECGIHPLS